jgi:hypothetical protein
MPASVEEIMRSPAIADAKRQDVIRERLTFSGSVNGLGSPNAMQVGSSVRDLSTGPVPPPSPDDTGSVYIYPTLQEGFTVSGVIKYEGTGTPPDLAALRIMVQGVRYLLAPAEDVEPGEWFDPTFLQRVSPAAVRVTIGEGEKKVQSVRVGGG